MLKIHYFNRMEKKRNERLFIGTEFTVECVAMIISSGRLSWKGLCVQERLEREEVNVGGLGTGSNNSVQMRTAVEVRVIDVGLQASK